MSPSFKFQAKIWVYPGKGGWHMLTLPDRAAEKIVALKIKHKSFGMINVLCKIGNTQWSGALFKDKKKASYILPVKYQVRKSAAIKAGDEVEVHITIPI